MPQVLAAPPSIATYSHGANNQAIEVQIHPKTNRVTVYFDTNAGDIAFTGTEGDPLIAADTFPVVADAPFTVLVDSGPDRVSNLRIYTQVAASPTTVKIISEAD